MQNNKPALKDIDDLKDLLKSLFSSLEKEITKIDDQFNLVELDFMYGNIDENFYNEKMWQLSTEIYKVKQKLTNIQNLENRIH